MAHHYLSHYSNNVGVNFKPMTERKVVYADRQTSKAPNLTKTTSKNSGSNPVEHAINSSDGATHTHDSQLRDLSWIEYSGLQWLDEATHSVSTSTALPLTIHIAPKQNRIDMIFSDHAEIAAKRLYMLAFSKSLTSSLSIMPITQHASKVEKGMLVTIQGDQNNTGAMKEFLQTLEIRSVLPEEAIRLMLPETIVVAPNPAEEMPRPEC